MVSPVLPYGLSSLLKHSFHSHLHIHTNIEFVVVGSHSAEADSQTEWTDVQKKIIPWKNSTPSLDLETAFQDRAAKLGKSNSRLIVVASLIDKPTNLGGKVDC